MFAQLPPLRSQRCHWYAYVIGAVPVQLPFEAVSVSPALASPEIRGFDVLDGGADCVFGAAPLAAAKAASVMRSSPARPPRLASRSLPAPGLCMRKSAITTPVL